MSQVFTVYSVFFIATSLLSFSVAMLAWQRRTVKGARELTLLMIAAGIWTFWVIFDTASITMTGKILSSKFAYIGAVSTPVLYLIFVLRFTGKDVFISAKKVLLLFIIPIITLVLAFTNEKHQLVWSGFSDISEETNIMEYYHGLWFWIGYMAYNYLILILATVQLFIFIVNHTRTFRLQAFVVFIAGLCPWIASAVYLSGSNPVPGLDLVPVSMILSGSLFAYAILYIRFLDLVPVARETLVETLPDGIMVLDESNRIQDINEAALSFLGISNKYVIGSPAGLSGATEMILMNSAISKESVDQIEILGNRETKIFRITKKPIKNQPGSRLVVIHDITDRKQAENALIQSENQKAAILKVIPDLLFVFNQNGEYLDIYSDDDSKLIMPREKLIGKSISELFPSDTAEGAIEAFKKSIKTKELVQFSYSINNSGNIEFFEARIVPAPDNKVLAIVSNITERIRAEKELIKAKEQAEESDRLKSAFLANMSHEIRTPMNGILGFTELLKKPDLSGEQKQAYIQIIKSSSDRMLNIINNLMDISKIEAQQIKISLSETNINEQIGYIYTYFKPEVIQKGIEISYKTPLPANKAIINTDKEKIYAILSNLIKNAVKFTHKGRIEFGYEKKDKTLEFFVKDTGTGILPEHKEFIFERFRQSSESLSRNYEGAGLGLSISKAYVEMLGGRIWVESELGISSVFYFTIPYDPVSK